MKTDLINGKPIKSIILFSLPIMASSLLQYNYNLVDNIIVGRYVGTNALAAVGNVASINSFIIGASLGLTAGFTIPVAQSFGGADYKRMNKLAGNSITLAFLIGIVISLIGHILSTPLLRLIDTPDEIIKMSSSYINILYFAIPVQMALNNFNAISRAVGDSKKPLYILICSVTMNFVLDLILVAHYRMGVEGAAVATVISQVFAATLSGISVFRHERLNITASDLKLTSRNSFLQVKLGIPISLQFTITSIGTMAVQSAINSFGTTVMSGLTAASRVEQLTNIPMSGLGVGNMTFVSQNYGAKKYDRITDNFKKLLAMVIGVSVVCSILLVTVGPSIVKLFMSEYNPQIMAAAKTYLHSVAACYSLVAVLFVFRNTLQGLGFTYANMIAGAGEFFGRIAVAFLLTPVFGFPAVCFSAPCAWLLADIPLIVIYLKKKRQFNSVS